LHIDLQCEQFVIILIRVCDEVQAGITLVDELALTPLDEIATEADRACRSTVSNERRREQQRQISGSESAST
jgi:hypothetical protein